MPWLADAARVLALVLMAGTTALAQGTAAGNPAAATPDASSPATAAGAPTAAGAADGADPPWLLAGRQGIVHLVVVPTALARDRPAYQRQIDRICQPDLACFINFYTNQRGVPVGLPLADEIDHQATATFRRSPKRAAESFTWSCRLAMGAQTCF